VGAVYGGGNVGGKSSRRRSARGKHFRQRLCLEPEPGQLLTDVVVQILGHASLDFLGNLQQVLFEIGPLNDPAQLHPDGDHCVGNPPIGPDDPVGEELQNGRHLFAHQYGEGGGRANCQFFRHDRAALDQVLGQVVGPLRLAAGEDASGQALASAKPGPERQLAERGKTLGGLGVVDVGGHQLFGVIGGRQHRVAEAPPVVGRHPLKTVFYGLFWVLGLIRHRGGVVQHPDRPRPLLDSLFKRLRCSSQLLFYASPSPQLVARHEVCQANNDQP